MIAASFRESLKLGMSTTAAVRAAFVPCSALRIPTVNPPTSAPGLVHPSHICPGTGAQPCHICAGTGLNPATSVPRGPILPSRIGGPAIRWSTRYRRRQRCHALPCPAMRCSMQCCRQAVRRDRRRSVRVVSCCAVQVIFHEVPHNVGDFAILLQVSERSHLWLCQRATDCTS